MPNDVIVDFLADNNSVLFKFKQEITGETIIYGTNNVEIMVQLKYPENFFGKCLKCNW